MVFSVWITPSNSNSTTLCNLDSFSLHSNSECSPGTSTANALSRSEDQWSSPFLYSLEYLCAIDHFCVHFKGGKPQKALRATSVWRIQSAQDVSMNRFLGNILTTLGLAQNNQHKGKRLRQKEEVGKSHRNFSSKIKPTAGTPFKFGLA